MVNAIGSDTQSVSIPSQTATPVSTSKPPLISDSLTSASSERDESGCFSCVSTIWNCFFSLWGVVSGFFSSLWECVAGSSAAPVSKEPLQAQLPELISKLVLEYGKIACIATLDGKVIAAPVSFHTNQESTVHYFTTEIQRALEGQNVNANSVLSITTIAVQPAEEGKWKVISQGITSNGVTQTGGSATGLNKQEVVQKLMGLCGVTAKTCEKGSPVYQMIQFLRPRTLKEQLKEMVTAHASCIKEKVVSDSFEVAVVAYADEHVMPCCKAPNDQIPIDELADTTYDDLSDLIENHHDAKSFWVRTVVFETKGDTVLLWEWCNTLQRPLNVMNYWDKCTLFPSKDLANEHYRREFLKETVGTSSSESPFN